MTNLNDVVTHPEPKCAYFLSKGIEIEVSKDVYITAGKCELDTNQRCHSYSEVGYRPTTCNVYKTIRLMTDTEEKFQDILKNIYNMDIDYIQNLLGDINEDNN